jgi:hypothetical protein
MPIFSYPWQLPTSMASLVIETGKKIIADVVVNGDL